MLTITVLAVIVFCALSDVKSEESYGRDYRMPEYVRIKRAKYYSNPPMRFYSRPPPPQPVRGIFSYTPPPNYMEDESLRPEYPRPTKVSKRPSTPNEGLGKEDINNLVTHLSKQDLERIINIAGEKYRDSPVDKYSNSQNLLSKGTENVNVYEPTLREFDTNKRFSQGPYLSPKEDVEYNSGSFAESTNQENNYRFSGPYAPNYIGSKSEQSKPVQIFYLNRPQTLNNNLQDVNDVPFESQETVRNNQFSFVDAYIRQELNDVPSHRIVSNDFTENKEIQEEQLPKPVNLREDDFQASNTDNVPRVVKASSYKVESFGDLPLMDYNSKLHTVSSYHVPHYSVISQQSQQPLLQSSISSQLLPSPSSYGVKAPKVERAPHPSAAREQSDAHLKAIKIWTHMSRGAAYTLHDDGTLSLEKGRPKLIYGP